MKRFCAAVGVGIITVIFLAPEAGSHKDHEKDNDPKLVINYRKFIMKAQGAHLGAIKAVASGKMKMPAQHYVVHADAINALNEILIDLFPKGTWDHEGSRAKKEIWEKWDHFKGLVTNLEKAGGELLEAGRNGDLRAMAKGLRKVGRACSACHKLYREKL